MPGIRIQVGNENFGPGLTIVALEADNSIRVQNVRRLEIRKKLTEPTIIKQVIQAVGYAQRKDILKLEKPRAKGLPDEARYKIEIEGNTLDVWDGDLAQNPQLAELVSLLRELVNESTNGEVML